MKSGLHGKAYTLISVIFIFVTALLAGGCSFMHQSVAALRSTDNFIPSVNDNRVLFEPGAEVQADKVATFLPSSIEQIEKKQYHQFVEPVHVYVCASRESFKKFYGADVRGGVLTKLFVSPRIFEYGDEIAKKYLTHELSHLQLQQQLGIFKTSRLPMWFKEGLAAYVSDGGGAHLVSQEQEIEFIRSGKYFVPNKADGFIFKKTPGDFGLEPHMFYRQSLLFIGYLATLNESAFRKLLSSIENGERLHAALLAAYNKDLEELWKDFLRKITRQANLRGHSYAPKGGA